MAGFLLITAVLLPMLSALLIAKAPWLNDRRENRCAFVGAMLVLECVVVGLIALEHQLSVVLFYMTPELPIALRSDGTSRVFSIVMALMWAVSGFFSFRYMSHEKNERSYYAFYMLALGSLMALTLSGTMVTMYLFFEMTTLLTVPLVLHTRTKESIAAGIKYLIYSVAGATMGLLGIFFLTPNLSSPYFVEGGSLMADQLNISREALLGIIFVTLVGFGTKAGMFPMHGWLPTAHPVAPAPASAVLSGVITKAGVLCIFRMLFYVIGPDFIRGTWVQAALLSCSTITVFMGSMLALREKQLKRRLAYSSVSQVSYVLCGLYLLDVMAFDGALLQIVVHALTKNALFLCAGAIIFTTGVTHVDDLRGMGKHMPWTMWLFTVCAISLVGIPPLGGFISKWYIAEGALSSQMPVAVFSWLVPTVLLVSALLTAGYLLPPSITAFFDRRVEGDGKVPAGRAVPSLFMLVPMLILTIAIAVLGIFPGFMINAFNNLADALF